TATLPVTVALPALIFHACAIPPPEDWLIVTSPFTVRALLPLCVNEFTTLLFATVSEVAELSLFIVIEPVVTTIPGNVVDCVPPILCAAPVNVTVLLPPARVPPLFVQLPSTVRLK